MRKTLRATLSIPVTVHWSAYVVLVLAFLSGLLTDQAWLAAAKAGLKNVGMVVCLFGIVTAHEFGHCFEAIRRDIYVDQITLWFLGGAAQINIDAPFIEPADEFWISVAGPAVNALFILAAFPITLAVPDGVRAFVMTFVIANAVLLAFNLLPAFPMDGGRILRSVLSTFMDRVNAQIWTSYTAIAFASAFIIFGVINAMVMLVLVGVLVAFINYMQINGDGSPIG